MFAVNRSGKTILMGAATGLLLGALTNMGLLPLGGLMSLIAGGEGGGGGGLAIMDQPAETNFETYDVPKAMAAIYNNTGFDDAGYQGVYLQAYANRVGDAIRQACGPASPFTTAEIKASTDRIMANELAKLTPEYGLNALAGQFKAWGDILSNPRENTRKYIPEYDPNEIPMTAPADGVRFAQEYGCDGATMKKFADNWRSFLNAGGGGGGEQY